MATTKRRTSIRRGGAVGLCLAAGLVGACGDLHPDEAARGEAELRQSIRDRLERDPTSPKQVGDAFEAEYADHMTSGDWDVPDEHTGGTLDARANPGPTVPDPPPMGE